MHQYLGHFSYVIISVDRLIRMKRSEATRLGKHREKSPILPWCSVEYRSRIATWETQAFQF